MTDTNTASAPKKATIPAQSFDVELTPGSSKSAISTTKATKGEMLNVDPALIREIPGFNVRIETPDYLQHIETIALSMVANGYYQNKPLGVFAAKDDDGNYFALTDGHTRLRAVARARELGAEINTVPVVVKPQTQTMEDLIVALVQDNEGRPLGPYERAIVVKRLEGFGWDDETIANRLAVTPRYVSDLKVLAGAPASVRDLVVKGKVSATEAVKQLRKDPAKASEVLRNAVKTAESTGKVKATAKDVKKATGENAGGDADEKTGVSMTKAERGGKLHATITYRFKQGDIVETDKIRPVWLFNDAAWWDYVDEDTDKDHVVINETISFEVKIVSAIPADEQDGENEQDADAALEAAGQIEDQTDGAEGEGEGEPSIDHASGDAGDTGGL